jgi:hypothetical protein
MIVKKGTLWCMAGRFCQGEEYRARIKTGGICRALALRKESLQTKLLKAQGVKGHL